MSLATATTNRQLSAAEIIGSARAKVGQVMPYFRAALIGMTMREAVGLGTLAMTETGIMLYDPAYIVTLESIEECAGLILHELMHWILKHSARYPFMQATALGMTSAANVAPIPDRRLRYLANLAFDAAIYPLVTACGLKLPKDAFSPATLKMESGLNGEQYFVELVKREIEKMQQEPEPQPQPQPQGNPPGEPNEDGDQNGSGEGDGDGTGQEGGEPQDGDGAGDGNGESQDSDGDGDGAQGKGKGKGKDGEQEGEPGGGGGGGHGGGRQRPRNSGGEPGHGQQGEPGAPGDQQGDGKGDGQDSAPERPRSEAGKGNCGSAACNPVEGEPEPGIDDPGQRGEAHAERVRKAVAEAIKEASRGYGNVPGALSRWAGDRLAPPTIPWREKLSQAVRQAATYRAGAIVHRYDAPSRRQSALGFGSGCPVIPRLRAPLARVAVVVDTSGSMCDEALSDALGEISGVLQAVQSKITFIAADASVHSFAEVRTLEELKPLLKGGGGTDFCPAFTALEKMQIQPEIVVYVTDGDGRAPTKAPTWCKVIWTLVGRYQRKPAEWGEIVKVTRTDSK